jgi:hypothetical protein
MTIYDEVRPVIAELMGEFKQGVIQYIKLTPAAGPQDEPGAPTETAYTLDAVTPVKGASYKFVQSGLAVATDSMVTCSLVAGLTLDMKDFITINGVRFKIIAINPIPLADPVAWQFIVRKGG